MHVFRLILLVLLQGGIQLPLKGLYLHFGVILYFDFVIQDLGRRLKTLIFNDQISGICAILESETHRSTPDGILNVLQVLDLKAARQLRLPQVRGDALPRLRDLRLILEFAMGQISVLLVKGLQVVDMVSALLLLGVLVLTISASWSLSWISSSGRIGLTGLLGLRF